RRTRNPSLALPVAGERSCVPPLTRGPQGGRLFVAPTSPLPAPGLAALGRTSPSPVRPSILLVRSGRYTRRNSCQRKHATSCSSETLSTGTYSVRHAGIANAHRGWNAQPDGRFRRSGGEPGIDVSRSSPPTTVGTASSSARVYG